MEALLHFTGSLLWYGTVNAPPWTLCMAPVGNQEDFDAESTPSKSKHKKGKQTGSGVIYEFLLDSLDAHRLNKSDGIFNFEKDLNTAYGYLIAHVHPTICHTLNKLKFNMPHLIWAYLKETYAFITKVTQKQAVTTFFRHHCQTGTPIKQYIKFFDEAAYQLQENGINVDDNIQAIIFLESLPAEFDDMKRA